MHSYYISKYNLKDVKFDLRIDFTIHAKTGEISENRKIIENILKKYEIKYAGLFIVGYDEIVTNIVEHSYEYDASRITFVELFIKDKVICIQIIDDGPAYDITKKRAKSPKRQLKKGADGGYGMYLLKRIFNKIDYFSENKNNYIFLEFNASRIKLPVS